MGVLKRNERQHNSLFIVVLAVNQVGSEQANRAVGLFRVGAPKDVVIGHLNNDKIGIINE